MPTLAQTLAMTTPVSPLLRKARRFGLRQVGDIIALAAARGCDHYRPPGSLPEGPARDVLADEDLVILLLLGENAYEPMAIRCAAQLARLPGIDPVRLVRLATMEKTGRVLSHIARAGVEHDPEGRTFWDTILAGLPDCPPRSEPDLPHWSRFVSMPGYQRGGPAPARWLVARP